MIRRACSAMVEQTDLLAKCPEIFCFHKSYFQNRFFIIIYDSCNCPAEGPRKEHIFRPLQENHRFAIKKKTFKMYIIICEPIRLPRNKTTQVSPSWGEEQTRECPKSSHPIQTHEYILWPQEYNPVSQEYLIVARVYDLVTQELVRTVNLKLII